jgi:N6-adenosine-specific RNA methylase IME4
MGVGGEMNNLTTNWYKELIADLKKLAFEGIVKTKWAIGLRILEDNDKFGKPEYGSKRIENIAKDLRMGKSDLYACIQFAKRYRQEIPMKSENSTWEDIVHKELPSQKREPKQLAPLPKGKYRIIYADPPWDYWGGGYKNQSQHYDTMVWQDIYKIPISTIAADDCILFLWATFPALEQALEVMKGWGFRYSTAGFVWVKSTQDKKGFAFGCGYWTRANAELCLIGIKGSIERKDKGISQIIYEPTNEHSKKPEIVKDKIIQLVGDLPRIELFARKQTKGWDTWGNETTKFNDD